MSPNPLDSVASLHAELDTALQQVLDTLAGALSGNATTAKAAADSVVNQLRQLIRTVDGALNADMDAIIQRVINELQAASAVSSSLLDTVVAQLAPLSPNFSPQTATSQAGQTPPATSMGEVASACIPDFDGTCEEFLRGGWVYSPMASVNNCPPGPAYSTTTRGGYFSVSSYYAYLAKCAGVTGPTGLTGPTGPVPLTGPTGVLPTGPEPTLGTWSIMYLCDPWSIRAVPDGDVVSQQSLVAAGWRVGKSGMPGRDQSAFDAYVASNSAYLQSLFCPAAPTGPIYSYTGPPPPDKLPVSGPTCPPCPPCPTAPTLDVAPAQGEKLPKAGPCWDVVPFTVPKFDLPLAGVLEPIGSEAWCKNEPKLIAAFQVSGHLLSLFADAITTADPQLPATPPEWFVTTVGAIPLGIGNLLCDLYVVNVGIINSLMRIVRNVLATGLELLRAVSCGNPDALVSLILARALLRAFRRIRIGTDVGLWATLDLEVQWDQAEQIIGYLIKLVCPAGVPSSSQAMESFRKGRIGEPQYRCWMLMNGEDPDVWNPVYLSSLPVPGIGQIDQMLYRLRQGKAVPGKEFLDADYDTALHRAGYSEEYRGWLEQIRYRVYTLREIRQLLDTGIVQQSEIEDAYRDEGFDADKAKRLSSMERIVYLRRHEAEIQGFTTARIAELYGRGIYDTITVESRMNALGYSDADAKRLMDAAADRNKADQARKWALKSEGMFIALIEKQYKEAVITPQTAVQALESQGALSDAAASIVSVWEEEVKFAYLTSAIAAIKKGWDTGLLSSAGAEQALLQVGVGLAAAKQRVKEWLVNLSVSQNVTTARDTLRFVAEGMLSPIDAAARLRNMGWLPTDADVLIQESLNKLHATEVRQQASVDKQIQAQAKAAAALVKQADAAKRAGQSALKRLTPVSTLNKWLKEGLIGTELYTSRMADMGYPLEEINVYIADISQSKGANVVEAGAVTDLGAPDSGGAGANGA